MYTAADRDSVIGAFREGIEEFLASDSVVLNYNPKDIFLNSVKEGNGSSDLRDFITNNICDVAKSAIPVGCPLLAHTVRVVASETAEGKYSVSVRLSPVKASYLRNFDFRKNFTLDELTSEALIRFVASSYSVMIQDTLAKENLEKVNERTAEALSSENAGRSYSVRFVIESEAENEGRSFVDLITDDEVVFAVPTEKAFGAASLAVFSDLAEIPEAPEGDESEIDEEEYELEILRNEAIERAFSAFAQEFAPLERTVDVVAARLKIVRVLTNITTHKPSKLIRQSFLRNIGGIKPNVKKTLTARVEHEDVLAGVERNGETGEFVVVLSPINTETLEPVDFDVIEFSRNAVEANAR